jgi:ubiquitin carboxyl-terminal hydrolase 5/13
MASVLQCLMPLPSFVDRYYTQGQVHLRECRQAKPTECYHCQMAKIADGLFSGRYSAQPAEFTAWKAAKMAQAPPTDAVMSPEETEQRRVEKEATDKLFKDWQPGVAPRMFKALIGGQHPEFKTNKQQDAFEFVQFFLQEVARRERAHGVDPTAQFSYMAETRLECLDCHRVRYTETKGSDWSIPVPVDISKFDEKDASGKPIPPVFPPVEFSSCVAAASAPQMLDSYNCPHCQKRTRAVQTSHFKSFPDTLVVHMSRFVSPGWVPVKLNVEINLPERIDLESLRGRGLQPSETAMPQSGGSAVAPPKKVANPEQVAGLVMMGFSTNASTRAVLAVNNSGAEAASNWLFAHMEDPDINDPVVDTPATAAGATPAAVAHDPMVVAQLASMGFDDARVNYALTETKGDMERALDWLFSHADDPLPVPGPAPVGAVVAAAAAAAAGPALSDGPGRFELSAFMTHLGTSTGCGHYVAHVKQADGTWVRRLIGWLVGRSVDLCCGFKCGS